MVNKRPSLEDVFSPASVAVVGANEAKSGRSIYGRRAVECLKEACFPVIYPVNPRHTEVLGLPCYPSLSAVPGNIDHAIIAIPAESALTVLDECAAKGVKSVHIFTAGFSESGDGHRAELERALLQKARSGNFRIIGPNCMGIFVPGSRLNTWRDVPLEPGPIAVLSQSGGFAEDIPYYGDLRGLRFSKVVSYGNGLDVDESELLEYFAQDVETEIIAAYIEGVKDGRRFIKALKEAAARKPVVIYKGGATRAGKRAAQGHTASLAGATDIFQTVCRQTNVIQVNNLDEMLDMLVALRFTRPFPRSTGAGVVGRGGGISVLSGDEIELSGLKLPLLSAEVQTELKKILPVPGSIFGNPVDSSALTSPEAILPTMRLVGQVADISILVYHLGFHPSSRWGDGRLASPDVLKALTDALSQAQQSMGKPVIVALHPAPALAEMKDFLAAQEAFVQAGFPVFYSMRQAGTAMARLIAWNNRRNTAR